MSGALPRHREQPGRCPGQRLPDLVRDTFGAPPANLVRCSPVATTCPNATGPLRTVVVDLPTGRLGLRPAGRRSPAAVPDCLATDPDRDALTDPRLHVAGLAALADPADRAGSSRSTAPSERPGTPRSRPWGKAAAAVAHAPPGPPPVNSGPDTPGEAHP